MSSDPSWKNDRRRKVDEETMHMLVRKGWSNAKIVRWLKSNRGVTYSSAGVTAFKRAHNYDIREWTPERLNLLPWRVIADHTGSKLYQALHAEARLRAGLRSNPNFELPREAQQRRDRLIVHMTETDSVIHYDQVNGFVLVPAREGIDNDLIRDPRVADDGIQIEDPTLWQ